LVVSIKKKFGWTIKDTQLIEATMKSRTKWNYLHGVVLV